MVKTEWSQAHSKDVTKVPSERTLVTWIVIIIY